eukprot:scaffold2131_cov113-Isochrysis_galbana.AAC.4
MCRLRRRPALPLVASAVFSIFILYLGAAKNRPITVTDVQGDGRPLALSEEPWQALLLTEESALLSLSLHAGHQGRLDQEQNDG